MADTITIGADKTLQLSSVRDAATGDYLNAATVGYTLYTAAGASVATGSLSYVAASAGVYRGVIESAVTSTLTAGAAYYVRFSISQSGADGVENLDLVAQPPGGTILDENVWMDSTGQSLSGSDLTAVRRHIAAVVSALERKCYPYILSPRTLTLFPFDAPVGRSLWLPKPVRSISALYYHSGANGDASVLDLTADLLVAGTDYFSRPTDVLTGWNRTGEVVRLNRSAWGWINVRPPTFLAYRMEPEPGSVFVSASVGPASVDPCVTEAACRAVMALYQRRKTGVPLQSESWGGYSTSYAGPFTAESALNSPEVVSLLRDAGVLPVHVGGAR